jgi:hypothetical protein
MDQQSSCSEAAVESNPPFGDATVNALQMAVTRPLKNLI